MFYVITRRTLRNVFLVIILLVILFSILLNVEWRRPEPNSGVVARSVMTNLKKLFLRDEAPTPITPTPNGEVDTQQQEEAAETLAPNIVTTTVTIGDPWRWQEGEPIPSAEGNRTTSGRMSLHLDGYEQEALTVTGSGLRSSTEPVVDIKSVDANRFAAFRLERDVARSRQLEYLHGVLNNPELGQVDKQATHEDLLKILKQAEIETNIENLLLASGFSEAVVIIAENGVSVVVNSVISQNEAARIGNLVAKMAQVRPEDVRILDADGV